MTRRHQMDARVKSTLYFDNIMTDGMTASLDRRTGLLTLGGFLVAVLVGTVVLDLSHAYKVGFSGADESAHFLNGYFVSLYLKGHFGANPIAFANDFYVHYPKLSIGHWPPGYYGILGVIFLIVPPTPTTAFAVNLLVSSLPAAGVSVALAQLASRRTALAGAVVWALAPLSLEAQAFFMLDQVLAACCVAATIAWVCFTRQPNWRRTFIFATLCVLAVLIKGNGWLLLFVPIYHTLLTRRWELFTSPYPYVAAAVVALVAVPWYWLTAGISADGFNYQAGWHYAAKALSANVQALAENVSVVGVLLAAIAIAWEYRLRMASPARWSMVSGCLSLILATLTLQSLVPADITDRYLTPALPPLVVLALVGASRLLGWVGTRAGSPAAAAGGALIALAILSPGIIHLAQRGPKIDLHMADIMPRVVEGKHPTVWIIDGSSGAEGAFIAEMAVRDPTLVQYAARASKVFAKSNFMGTQYRLKFADSGAVLDELRRLGVQGVVVVRIGGSQPFPHSQQLAEALARPDSPFWRVLSLPDGNGPGLTEVFESVVPVTANIPALRRLSIPAKASSFTGAR